MVATPPGKIAFLDRDDLFALKVIVRDPFRRKAAGGSQSCGPAPDSLAATASAAGRASPVRTSHKPDSLGGKRSGRLRLR
jgi:hypothetical protein